MTIPPGPPPSEGPPSEEPPRGYAPEPYPVSAPVYAGYYGQPDHRPPPSKAMAGWALGLSLFNCLSIGCLVAIGLAIAVLVKGQRDGRDHGKGMAIAALIISALWLVAFAVLIVLAITGKIEFDDSERDSSGEITHAQELSLSSMRVGDCMGPGEFEEWRNGNPLEITAVPCSDLHSAEVFHVFDLADGDFPGEDEVTRLAEAGCINAFRDFVGVPPARSELEVYYAYPVSITWRVGNDREVMCFVNERDESTVGTLEGSKR